MILNSPYITGSLIVTGNIISSGSITLSGSIASASFATSASQASTATTSSFATTASFALNAGGGAGFPYTGIAAISGSLVVTGSLTVITGSSIELQVTNTGVKIGNVATDIHTITGSAIVSGSLTVTGSLNASGSGTMFALNADVLEVTGSVIATSGFTGSLFGTASLATTASFALNAGGGSGFPFTGAANITGSLTVITGSLIEFQVTNAGIKIGNATTDTHTITGSLNVTGSTNLRGSSSVFTVDGTSGRLFSVDDSLSGSLFSVNTAAGLPVIEAFSDNTVRIGRYGTRVLYVSQSAVGIGKETLLNGLLDVSGSATVTGSLNINGSLNTTGTITAQTLVVQTVTSSVIYSSGSNIFGNNIANTQTFTGSVLVTGSVTSQGGFILGNSATIAPTGSIGYNNAIGVFIYGKSGSEADFRLYNRDGLTAMSVVAGTQNVHFNGNVGIGTSNIPAEANLSLGAKSTLEGGQLILQRGTSQVSASHLDNYSNQFRIISGTDTASNTVRMSMDMTNGATTFFGSVTSPSLYGNSYSQTSASGTTSFVNTGIFYNTSLTGFFNNGTYLLAVTGNPNGAGSSEYRGVYIGYIFVTTGYDFGITNVVQRINYTQLVTGDPLNIGALTISAVFWDGTTETTQQINGTTNNQIRIKISGYNSSNIGAAQVVTLTKVI
jgi:hypothetical protein